MSALKGIEYLRNKLANKRIRVRLRYDFYEMKDKESIISITIPAQLRYMYRSTFGWCAKSVDALADRLQFRGFDNDNFQLTEIFNMNNPDVLFDSAILGALISSCDFIYISADKDGFPRLQVIDGGNATGVIDPQTGMLQEGYAVLDRDSDNNPTIEAYFLPKRTEIWYKGERNPEVYEHMAPYPLLVPIINRPDAKRPFGHSRISRACMDLQNKARATLERSEISAEFYSFPQKYVLGLSADTEGFDQFRATISSMLDFRKDEDGDVPTVGQFTQQSMSPYTEQLRTIASVFAGETGLTLDDLGFATENPSSSEAIKAAHENLRLTARKAQRGFGSNFLNVGYLAACLRDEFTYERSAFYQTKPVWYPVFEPDASSLSLIGDGAIKINQAVPDFFTEETLKGLTGINND
ncbi:MAG: phage portal protein [Firmicutes bacterium]|nr:phage portal protein [Bacillota bacterium]